ncbi:MAG: aminoacetone oxidase family FAD-binding enzyme [Elusimicrobiaceae bacterium]|nr:aminoacetone oxidase family FAD-binding enzyme [Elusimicrobiaceae bacterium]
MGTLYDVAIVGAGASGLICAVECARGGKHTLLLEKDTLPARKILVSGNGRCNLTNRYVSPTYYYTDPKLIESALAHFSFENCLKYFENLGVLLTEQEQGRVFPATGKATAVADALKVALKEAGAELICGQEVIRIKHTPTDFTLTTRQGLCMRAKCVVLACGSCAYPQVTGTHAGYELAHMLGHNIIPPLPVLSGLCLKEAALTRLSGIKCQVKTTAHTTPAAHAEGELIFTNYGINGPAALNISQTVSRALAKGPVKVEINFLAQLDNPREFLEKRLQKFSTRKPKEFFAGLLHESISNLLIDFTGLRKQIPVGQQPMNHVFETLTAWPVTITALRPWKEAMVAAGGVKTREINYNTFESLLCPGLYITGELLDVDGKSGGLNLHFAWASGFTAAQAIIKEK